MHYSISHENITILKNDIEEFIVKSTAFYSDLV